MINVLKIEADIRARAPAGMTNDWIIGQVLVQMADEINAEMAARDEQVDRLSERLSQLDEWAIHQLAGTPSRAAADKLATRLSDLEAMVCGAKP